MTFSVQYISIRVRVNALKRETNLNIYIWRITKTSRKSAWQSFASKGLNTFII